MSSWLYVLALVLTVVAATTTRPAHRTTTDKE
ncbi:hypothetical protein SUDANB178_07755 (plasmid) [Streptomyces sp. enrichment culture]